MVLSRMGLANDPRAGDALDLPERRRLKDGRSAGWLLVEPGHGSGRVDVVDGGRSAPMIALNGLRAPSERPVSM